MKKLLDGVRSRIYAHPLAGAGAALIVGLLVAGAVTSALG